MLSDFLITEQGSCKVLSLSPLAQKRFSLEWPYIFSLQQFNAIRTSDTRQPELSDTL